MRAIDGGEHRHGDSMKAKLEAIRLRTHARRVRARGQEVAGRVEKQLWIGPAPRKRGDRDLQRERRTLVRPSPGAPTRERPCEMGPDALEVG